MTRRLLLLNGLAVVGAVINHATGWGFTSLFWWTERYQSVSALPDFSHLGTGTYYALRLLEQLVTCSVPAFLFVSGFFVAFAAGRDPHAPGWSRLRGRLRMLLIPYLLWSLAILAGRAVDGASYTSAGFLRQLLFGRAAEPYYYIPLLTQLYLLSPLLVRWMKTHWKPVLFAAALVQFTVQLARYPVLLGWNAPLAVWIGRHAPGWFFPHMVFWFALGMFGGLHLSTLKQRVARWRRGLAWLTVALGLLGVLEWELLLGISGRSWLNPVPTALDSLYCVAFILTFVAFAESTVPVSRVLDTLGERSFGVYLIHAPVLELLARLAYHTSPPLLANQLLFQSLLIAGGLGVPLLIMAAFNRSRVRPYYNYLFG